METLISILAAIAIGYGLSHLVSREQLARVVRGRLFALLMAAVAASVVWRGAGEGDLALAFFNAALASYWFWRIAAGRNSKPQRA